MNYRNFIKNRQTRLYILKKLKWVPDSIMLPLQYFIQLGRWPNLRNPRRYTEKLQVYKMRYRNKEMNVCVDKYRVREYVKKIGLDYTLNELYGVYANANDIDFSLLPNCFVAKTTDGGGGNNVIICKDKSSLNIDETRKSLNSWLGHKNINAGREWAYTGIEKSQIIIEKYLENKDNPDGGITDFKIFCFNGKPYYIIVDWDRFVDHKRNVYSTKWEKIDLEASDSVTSEESFSRPDNLEEMLEIASKLSSEFPHVRVDLYNLNGKIYFGELTFYPWSGYVEFSPDTFDYSLGDLFDISQL